MTCCLYGRCSFEWSMFHCYFSLQGSKTNSSWWCGERRSSCGIFPLRNYIDWKPYGPSNGALASFLSIGVRRLAHGCEGAEHLIFACGVPRGHESWVTRKQLFSKCMWPARASLRCGNVSKLQFNVTMPGVKTSTPWAQDEAKLSTHTCHAWLKWYMMIHVARARGGNLIGVFCTQLPPETWAGRVNYGESTQLT